MNIRTITLESRDISGLTALMNQWDDLPHVLTEENILARIGQIKDRPNSEVLIAEDTDGKMAGYVCILESIFLGMDPFVELQSILVDSRYRRQGVGKMLIEKCRLWAREKGFSRIVLNSRVQLTGSHAFYKSLGFRETKQAVFFAIDF